MQISIQSKIKKTWASLDGAWTKRVFDENLEIDENDKMHFQSFVKTYVRIRFNGSRRRTNTRPNKKFHHLCKRTIKASGQHLNTLFDKAIRIGTRIRNSSGISQGGISVGSMAVKLAEENIDELKIQRKFC